MAAAPKQDAAAILQQLNLAALRTRMHDLQATISRIAQSIHANPSSKWVDVLDQFAVVNLELLSLVDDIKPMLRAFLVYPKNVTAANAPILPIMLSSKLLPELEAEEAALREQVLAPMSNLSLNAQSDKLQKQIELVRTVCDTADKVLVDARKSFGLGARHGGHPIPSIEKAQAARILEQEKQLHAAANFGDGLRMPSEQRTSSGPLPPHIAAALASPDDGFTRAAPQIRPATPQQIIPGASLNAGSPALRPAGGFSDMQTQQHMLQAMQKAKLQQKPFVQQQMRPSTPPLAPQQMQLANQGAPQSVSQQPSKMHQFPQHVQLNQQQLQQQMQMSQERHFHHAAQQMQPGQMRAYGNPQQPLLPNMMASISQPRMQYMSGQPQRNQMLPESMYGQSAAAGLGLPLQQQIPGQGSYTNNFVSNHPAMLNQGTLLTHNTIPTFNQVRQQQQPPTQ